MQALVTFLIVGIALFALACLAFGLLVVGVTWTVRKLAGAIPQLAAAAERQARSCYNEPLQNL